MERKKKTCKIRKVTSKKIKISETEIMLSALIANIPDEPEIL